MGGGPPSQLLWHVTASYGPTTLIPSHASAHHGSCRVISDGRLDRRTEAAELGREGGPARWAPGGSQESIQRQGMGSTYCSLGWLLNGHLGYKEEVLTGLTSAIPPLCACCQTDVERHPSDLGATQGTGCTAGSPPVIQVSVYRTSPTCLAPSEPAPSPAGATHAPSRCRPAGWALEGPAEGLPRGHQAPPAARGVRPCDGLFPHGNSAIWKFNRIIHNLWH